MSNIINPAVALAASGGQMRTVSTGPRNEAESLRKSCQDFEAIMLKSMLKEMRSTIPKDGLLGEGNDQEMFRDLMDQEVAMQMSRTQGIGIAESLYKQLAIKVSGKDED
ncbi:flagellar rod-binding protein FlgJ [Syntrophotalea carbinolica DSM 2380]|uniref:Flagellar rod-binding protein FlgJ n=1 Tax=Syntrophotalea carbinolica (strain DSM 2380 / NBRC 103641 / GraBd1) TaxID=338963 RepID=Q3A5F6_SYNC1|nr:rod-binding protein [Syntrophotalea carbinolica]ABA88401.1 flagellar rod-binding protein FlgJ [Syntrophotalea carbinolica DSM 2380]